MIKERDYLWDNIKAFLILTVVVGHFLLALAFDTALGEMVTFWIFTFHMPAFIFVSGFWSKSYCKNSKVRGEKATLLLAYYLAAQLLFSVVYCFIHPINFTLFDPLRGLWYLLALVIYYLILPVFEKLPAYIVMPLIILLALFIGTESQAGTFFTNSRAFTFAPFFFAGYYMSSDTVNKLRSIKLKYLLGSLSIVCGTALCFFTRNFYKVKTLYNILYGKSNYNDIGLKVINCMFLRLTFWLCAAFIIIGIVMIFPKVKTFFSYIGSNSLQIYVLHMIIIIFFKYTNIFDFAVAQNSLQAVWVALGGVLTTLILSINIFSYPFKWIAKGVNRIYKKPAKQ